MVFLSQQAELSLLVMDEDADSKKHFSLDKLIEESSGKKKKKNKKLEKQKKEKNEEEFQVRVLGGQKPERGDLPWGPIVIIVSMKV